MYNSFDSLKHNYSCAVYLILQFQKLNFNFFLLHHRFEIKNLKMMEVTGYSGTPLEKKLGLKSGFKIRLINQPHYYFNLFENLPENLIILDDTTIPKDFIHCFTSSSEDLIKNIVPLRKEIVSNGTIWISWHKKSSKIESDVTEDFIRILALANGLVDVKVCAIDDIWSGLKLVIPVKLRQ